MLVKPMQVDDSSNNLISITPKYTYAHICRHRAWIKSHNIHLPKWNRQYHHWQVQHLEDCLTLATKVLLPPCPETDTRHICNAKNMIELASGNQM